MRFGEKRKHHQHHTSVQKSTQSVSGGVDFPYGCSHRTQGTVWTQRSGPEFPTASPVAATCICGIHKPKKKHNRLSCGSLVPICPLLWEANVSSLQPCLPALPTHVIRLAQQLGACKARSCLTHEHLAEERGSHNCSALLQGWKGPTAFHYPPLQESQGQNLVLLTNQSLPWGTEDRGTRRQENSDCQHLFMLSCHLWASSQELLSHPLPLAFCNALLPS